MIETLAYSARLVYLYESPNLGVIGNCQNPLEYRLFYNTESQIRLLTFLYFKLVRKVSKKIGM